MSSNPNKLIYLYVKTHRITGLKYLGQTIRDPYSYKGSGIHWTRHIKKYGNEVDTTVIAECKDKVELKNLGIYYSKLWNVVSSPNWANCMPEEGSGGQTVSAESRLGIGNPMFGRKNPCSEDKQLAISKTKNKDKINNYKLALEMMKQGKSNRAIARELGINLDSTCKLKNGTHLIFKAFPELIQPVTS